MKSSDQSTEALKSRRTFLKTLGLTPLFLRAAPFYASPLGHLSASPDPEAHDPLHFADIRLKPQYPTRSPLADVLRLVPPGSDEYITEKYAFEIEALLQEWGTALKASPHDLAALAKFTEASIKASKLNSPKESRLRSGSGIEIVRRQFAPPSASAREAFLDEIKSWLAPLSHIETTEFQIYSITETSDSPLTVTAEIRYDLVSSRKDGQREERVGTWRTDWTFATSTGWKAVRWEAGEETLAIARGPAFIDITAAALSGADSYKAQMLLGIDHWRTVLDGASGVDVYSNNGVAAADFDNDGFDDFYVCQPSGLPNRLYRNRGDGTFEDVTEKAGVGVLDNTACALFADLRNSGLQDLIVVCGGGPLLFLNQGNGTFAHKKDAFKFAGPPQGTFTHAALADYDRDGRIDIYFCTYQYYLGLDQYHYPVPYYDARNGPANCLFHNEGDGTFVETTEASGLNVENNRYSFACAWGDSNSNGLPDLCIANDFGSTQLYRNNGDGTFKLASSEAHVEDVGAGMGAAWADINNDGRQDIYITSMWEAAGQRVAGQKQFHESTPASTRGLYQRHARGNALYRNLGDGTFRNIGHDAGAEMGRWSWSADFWDFDHDGHPDLYVTNGYISAEGKSDLASFFWRQVVAKSPDDASPSFAYERGWQAINELIRADNSWNAYERNVLFANNGDGTFSEVSGLLGMDFLEDSRSFALADIDNDGRLEVILKNRNAPQIRILRNAMQEFGQSISFRLKGTKSNRDAIGASIIVETGSLRQVKYLQAGTGFLAQHSKDLFFGLGKPEPKIRATVRWPNGLSQHFDDLPSGHRIEIEEGNATFTAKPFASAKIDAKASFVPPLQPLPTTVETWLIEPIKAPAFTLPDLSGKMQDLASFKGSFVLLNFWSSTSPLCHDQLKTLQRQRSTFAASHLAIVAINVDEPESISAARSLASEASLSFPVLFATKDIAGTYNIIYRYLFDRRRDLTIPTSFLLDKDGRIVKLYQGLLDPKAILNDVKEIPSTPAERLAKALPMKGHAYQSTFQRNDFTYGVAMFQHGYLDQAAESFEQVIAAKPDFPQAYYNLGTLNLRRNDFQQARTYLEKTVALRPNYPEAWNNLGMIAAHEGHPDEAVQNFQRAIDLRPSYAIALLNLGNFYRRQKNFAKAAESISRALAIEPDDPEANYSLGMLYAQQEQLTQAQDSLKKALALRPDYPEALNNLGVVYVQLQDYPHAEELFNTCIRLVPSFDQSYLNMARLDIMKNDKPAAREVLEQLLQLQPQNSTAKKALESLQ